MGHFPLLSIFGLFYLRREGALHDTCHIRSIQDSPKALLQLFQLLVGSKIEKHPKSLKQLRMYGILLCKQTTPYNRSVGRQVGSVKKSQNSSSTITSTCPTLVLPLDMNDQVRCIFWGLLLYTFYTNIVPTLLAY